LDDDRRAPIGAPEALHDVSNALTVLLGWLEEAAREDLPSHEVRRAIGIAARKAREARALAREAIGAAPAEESTRPARELAAEIVDGLAVEAARAGVAVALEVDDGVDGPLENATAVGHIVTNLLLNAIAFSPAGSTVEVRLTAGDRALCWSVQDRGPGVAPEIVGSLFEGRSLRTGGAGIGLRHARSIARALGGDLVHQPSPVGACFELRLPRPIEEDHDPSPRPSLPPSVRSAVEGTRVLVVEDDRAVCALLDAGLGARGVEVVALHDGHDLPSRIGSLGRFDAVLLDLSPIAGDPEGSVGAVRRALPDAGILFISGSAVALDPGITAGDPRTRWVRKPFEIAEITAALAELLRIP
jgi:CheY-like chemotaxis protein/anti-sigma regulatory factor (Ser/Thr protein kinase)